ncbi:MAG TPA: SigE family RNA polymerase sigma factor [Nocardioidaceae bacterium]|nr:SigE family RNA polymerase sigma factor [Nocardioidaceae bacterium]
MADEALFDSFVSTRVAALSRTAYLLTGDHHLAEDLVQTTLFKAAKAWHRIEGDPEPYVRRILHNENVSLWRRRRHLHEVPLEYAVEQAGGDGDHDLRLTLKRALAGLTPKQRAVIVLRFYEDLTEVQAAAVLGISAGTVKSVTRQALARLRATAPHLAELVVVGGEQS